MRLDKNIIMVYITSLTMIQVQYRSYICLGLFHPGSKSIIKYQKEKQAHEYS